MSITSCHRDRQDYTCSRWRSATPLEACQHTSLVRFSSDLALEPSYSCKKSIWVHWGRILPAHTIPSSCIAFSWQDKSLAITDPSTTRQRIFSWKLVSANATATMIREHLEAINYIPMLQTTSHLAEPSIPYGIEPFSVADSQNRMA